MPMKFPLTCITNAQRYAFCYRTQEALRLKHNDMGEQSKRNEITEKQYNNWIKFKFDVWQESVIEELLALRTVIKNNNPLGIDIEKVIQ